MRKQASEQQASEWQPAVTDTSKPTCPECNTPNEVEAPFCENCGFRLRRAPTANEHKAVTRPQRPKPRNLPPDTEVERPALSVADLRATIPEGVQAVRKTPPKSDESATVLEGLRPIAERTQEDIPAVRTPEPTQDTPPVRDPPAYTSGLHAAPAEEQKSSIAVFALLWVISTGALVLLTYFLAREEPETVLLKSDAGPIAIPAGPYTRGLSEQVRAFILMSCTRIAEDRNECDENKLLGGEFPQTTVDVPAYRIDSQEVTHGDWKACVQAGKCPQPDLKACKVYTNQGLQVAFRVPKQLQEDAMPVACVTHTEAQAYCAFAGGTLPSHDQWEKAARGNNGSLFPWGDGWDPTAANWGEFDVVRTSIAGKVDGYAWAAPPASFEAGKSPTGAYDMAGNVYEWVTPEASQTTTARGGSWASSPFDIRTTGRLNLPPDTRRADLGLRCAYAP